MGDPGKSKLGAEHESVRSSRQGAEPSYAVGDGDLMDVRSGVKLQINVSLAPKMDGVSEEYKTALNNFLYSFMGDNSYARKIISMVDVQIPDSADSILNAVRDVYEATGIDLMKEAFYQYWEQQARLPDFYSSEEGAVFDLSCIYSDDPRLHSSTDSTLGEYVDDWRNLDVTDEQRFWCEVAESTRSGLSPDVATRLIDQLVQRVRTLEEKPDVMTLIPSADPSKPFENYQMHPLAVKVAQKVGIPFPEPFVQKTQQTGRLENFKGDDKYFGRRSLTDGVLKVDASKVRDKTILLLDDGWSSGATLDVVKKALYEAGAKKVLSLHLVRC